MSETLIGLLIFSIAVSSALLALNKTLVTEQRISWHERALSLVEQASGDIASGKAGFISSWQQQVKQDLPDGAGTVSSSSNGRQIEVRWLGGSKVLRTVVLAGEGQ